ITVAHHESNDSFTQQTSFQPTRRKSHVEAPPVMTQEQLNELLSTPGVVAPGMEDLTGEVQNLMMSEWLDPWSSASNTPSPADLSPTDLTDFDAHQLSLQLESFFSQDPLDEGAMAVQSPFYDEMTFVPENTNVIIPGDNTHLLHADNNNLLNAILPQQTEQLFQDINKQQGMILEEEEEEEEIVQVDEDIAVQELDIATSILEQELVQPKQQQQIEIPMPTETLKRRRDSSSSESSSGSSGSSSSESESEDDEDDVIPTTVANMNNRQQYWSDSSDSDSEDERPTQHRSRASSPLPNASTGNFAYMHKRQIEETLLSKITNQLQQDKLPGILAILSSENNGEDEVEIDLSRLQREQLVRLLCYVDACIREQNGGPTVNVSDYIVKEKQQVKKSVQQVQDDSEDEEEEEEKVMPNNNKSRRRRGPSNGNKRTMKQKPKSKKSRQELTEDILAGSSDDEDGMADKENEDDLAGLRGQGPMSMAELSKRQDKVRGSSTTTTTTTKKSRKRTKRKNSDDAAAVVSSTTSVLAAAHMKGSIAASKPKRSSTHKKRVTSSDDSDGDEMGRRSNNSSGSELIVYGNEQMDFNVKSNETIVHQSSVVSHVVPATPLPVLPTPIVDDDDDLDEEIDIMM
ncbi:hypothetical protein INT45_000046, partial [Circinella minor]